MNRSGAPWARAYSASWWTGMKSRDAIAPATITVDVTSRSKAGSASPRGSDGASFVALAFDALPSFRPPPSPAVPGANL